MPTSGDASASDALAWVVGVLTEHATPYQIVGGLAARAHGATRPLADIDLYAPLAGNAALLGALAPHTTWGPEHHRDESWDLVFMKLDVSGQRIEIGDTMTGPRYFDRQLSCWTDQTIDFRASERHVLYGVEVDVMPAPALIAYKTALDREVDRQDIAEITASR